MIKLLKSIITEFWNPIRHSIIDLESSMSSNVEPVFNRTGDITTAGYLKSAGTLNGQDIYTIDEYVKIQDINLISGETINAQELIVAVDPLNDHTDLLVRFKTWGDGRFTEQDENGYTDILSYDELGELDFINDMKGPSGLIEVQMWDRNDFMHYYTSDNDDFYRFNINSVDTIDIIGVPQNLEQVVL